MNFFDGGRRKFKPGDRIEGYTVIAPAGEGGSGQVFLVEDVSQSKFILKLADGGSEEELEALRSFRSIPPCSSLAAIHAAGLTEDGLLYYLMDPADNLASDGGYVPDTPANRLAARGRFSAKDVLSLAEELLQALAHLHRHGFVHCDVKPENVIYKDGKALLADFGSLTSINIKAPSVRSTGGFLPPEGKMLSLSGTISPKNDLYALGMTAYSLWSGRSPDDYPSLPDKPDAEGIRTVRKIYDKACSRSPSFRFQSAEEFLSAVKKAEKSLEKKKFPLVRAIVFVIATVLVGVGIFAVMEINRRNDAQLLELRLGTAKMARDCKAYENLMLLKSLVPSDEWERSGLEAVLMEFEGYERLCKLAEENENDERLVPLAKSVPGLFTDPESDARVRFFVNRLRKLSPEEEKLKEELEKEYYAYEHVKIEEEVCRKRRIKTPETEERLNECREKRMAFEKDKAVQIELFRSMYDLERDLDFRTTLENRKKINALEKELASSGKVKQGK